MLCGTLTESRSVEFTQFTLYNGVTSAVNLPIKSTKAVSYLRVTVEDSGFCKFLRFYNF